MKIKFRWAVAAVSAVLLLSSGCETMGGGSQTQTTIYDIHRRVVKLDKELEGSVSKLNESTATLIARVDQGDEQTRTVRGLLEENQAKLDALSRELESMKTTLYRHWNLTTSGPAAGVPPNVSTVGPVTVEPPPTLQPQAPAGANELVDSAPLPTEPAAPAPVPAPTPVPADATLAPAPADAAPAPAPAAPADPGEYTSQPPVPAADGSDPRVIYQQAQRSYANDDFAGALGQFDTYLAQYPDNDLSSNAQFWKAKCLFNLNRYQESVQAFEGLRSNFPTSTKVPFAMHNQAVAHSRLGQNKEAERLMESVIDQYPVSPAADQARADLQKLRGGE